MRQIYTDLHAVTKENKNKKIKIKNKSRMDHHRRRNEIEISPIPIEIKATYVSGMCACVCGRFLFASYIFPFFILFLLLFVRLSRFITIQWNGMHSFIPTNQQIDIVFSVVEINTKSHTKKKTKHFISDDKPCLFHIFISSQRHKVSMGIKVKSWWWHNVNKKEFHTH